MLLFTHAARQGVDISFTVCLFVCLFVRLLISPSRIKLAASNFVRRFISVQGRESPIFVNFALPEAQNRPANLPTREPRTPLQYVAQSSIGRCGYRSVPNDVLVFSFLLAVLSD